MSINETHDPSLRSWVASANHLDTDFPIQNLPHGVFREVGGAARGGVAIGDQILDMQAAVAAGLFTGCDAPVRAAAEAAAAPELNDLMAMDASAVSGLRRRLQALLREDAPARDAIAACLAPMDSAEMLRPVRLGAFTDFMTSAPHIAGGRPARPEGGALPPCFWSLPIAYNSRASSVVVSGRPLERPWGQYAVGDRVAVGPTKALDYELEFGCFVGQGNPLGQPIRLAEARRHIFGFCIVNDWSARDVQRWESVLGPFQGKAFRTTISPWVVTAEAMAPFRQPLPQRPADAPPPPPHLHDPENEAGGGLRLRLRALLTTAHMKHDGAKPHVLTDTAFSAGAWSFEQMLTHHAMGGCNLETGDLISSGTLSGAELSAAACLLEITGGRVPVELHNGEQRLWLEDGDDLAITARAEREGYVAIGFGPCQGEIRPAVEFTV